MAQVHHKVQEVEKSVTRQLSKTLASIQELSARTDKQWVAITQAGAEARQLANKVLALEERLAQLEKGSNRGELGVHGALRRRRVSERSWPTSWLTMPPLAGACVPGSLR